MTNGPNQATLDRLRARLEARHAQLSETVERLELGATRQPGGGVAERQADEPAVGDTQDDDLDVLPHARTCVACANL